MYFLDNMIHTWACICTRSRRQKVQIQTSDAMSPTHYNTSSRLSVHPETGKPQNPSFVVDTLSLATESSQDLPLRLDISYSLKPLRTWNTYASTAAAAAAVTLRARVGYVVFTTSTTVDMNDGSVDRGVHLDEELFVRAGICGNFVEFVIQTEIWIEGRDEMV